MSDMTSLEKKRRLVVLALGIVIGLSVLVLAFSLFFAAEEPSSSARMSPAKEVANELYRHTPARPKGQNRDERID